MNDCEAREECGENDTDVKRTGDNAIGEQNRDGIGNGSVFGEHVEPGFIKALYQTRNKREAEDKKYDRGNEVIRHLFRVERGSAGKRCGDGQCEPENDIFEDRDSEYEAREAGMKNFEISKNLGDDGNGCDRDSDCENDNKRNAVAVRSGKGRRDEAWTQDEAENEWNAGTHNREPSDFAALFACEEVLCFCARKKHEQEQAEPVDEIQGAGVVQGGLDNPGGVQTAKERGAEDDTGQDLSDNPGLAQLHKRVAEDLGQRD